MFKKLYFLILVSFLLNNFALSQNIDNLQRMQEVCADELFIAQFGNKYHDYLTFPVRTKINKSMPYEIFYEDCEKQYQTKPMTFNLKSTLYQEDLNEVTSKVFERCGDEKYVMEFGDAYNDFLNLSIKEKMKKQLEYEWFIEECEIEYRTYPIKFKLKYF